MASRNLTKRFITFRNSFQTKRPKLAEDGSPLLSESFGVVAAPIWTSVEAEVKADLVKCRDTVKALSKLHAQRLKVTFGDEIVAQQERDIEILTQEVTRLMKRSENNIKRIAHLAGDGSGKDRLMRLNSMRALAAELQAQSKSFRQLQKEFLKNLRDQQQLGESFGFEEKTKSGGKRGSVIDDEALDKGLTAEQSAQLQDMAQRADERYKEIIKIAQSVSEISTLFRELNVLVIEQGTILDRIDYNIEQTLDRVEKGVVHLKEADKQSKKAYTMKCIIMLAVVMLILLIVLIVKSSNK